MSRASLPSKYWRVLRWAALAAAAPALWACTSRTLEAPTITPTATLTTTFTQKINNNLDILFMIDNSSSMASMQEKLYTQLPNFMNILTGLKTPPNLHVAVVSSDMGAPGDAAGSDGCTSAGDMGIFQNTARSDSTIMATCGDTTLTNGAYFISSVDGMNNFTNPNGIGAVFQCIALLGQAGCGFEHQLASIDRALGADQATVNPDGTVTPNPPSQNVGFLRSDAYLGIVLLTNEDDCSGPVGTEAYSLGPGNKQNLENALGLGPLANYRCNERDHLCQDPNSSNPSSYILPPLTPPADAQGTPTAPTLDLANCKDNDQNIGPPLLTRVSQFVDDIKALKQDPDNQILVAAITAPAAPYTVQWVPAQGASPGTPAGELWPQVEHSCGPSGDSSVNPETTMYTTDGSFGDPGVRISQFVHAFSDSVLASICDKDYSQSMTEIATKLGALIQPPCITGKIQQDSQNQPECSVIENLTDSSGNATHTAIPNCNENGNSAPCWTLAAPSGNSSCTGQVLTVNDPNNTMASSANSTISCSICLPGVTGNGC